MIVEAMPLAIPAASRSEPAVPWPAVCVPFVSLTVRFHVSPASAAVFGIVKVSLVQSDVLAWFAVDGAPEMIAVPSGLVPATETATVYEPDGRLIVIAAPWV